MQRVRVTAGLLMAVFCVLASAPASAIASPPDATTEAATAVSYEEATLKGSVNPLGSATTYWFEYGETKSYGTKIPASPKSVGSGSSNVLVSNLVTGLKESTTYHFRVVAESTEGMINGEDATFTTCGFNFSFGEKGSGNGQLSEPFGIAVDSKGNLWISDTGNNRIEEFDAEGKYLFQVGKKGGGNGEFEVPKGIAIDPEDRIWVVDSGNNRIQEFNTKGEFIRKAGEKGSGEGQFESPTGITIESSGERPYVTDTGDGRVEKFTKEGKYLTSFSKKGTSDGELMTPEGVLKDAKARLWVVDTGNNRVQRFNASTFAFVSKIGETGKGNGHFESPVGITADFQEKLWVADSGNDRAQKFDIDGEYLDKVGAEGTGAGQLIKPTGVAAPSPQKLLILDSGNDRVEVWAVPAEPPVATTNTATSIKATSATVRGTIDPEGLATSYWFEYGETTSYGTKIPLSPESVGSGLTGVSVEQTITGLKEGTKYRFRVVAESAAGASAGIDRGFTTLKLPDTITEAASAIKATKATLNGKVNPLGSATKYWFEYGETEAYGTKIPVPPESVGSGTEYVSVNQTPTGLKEGTTYHFRVVAESEAEAGKAIFGEDKPFTTLGPPDATTEPASSAKATQATLNGKVNPLGSATKYWFEYGETTSYGTKIPVSPESAGSGTEYVAVNKTPTGLAEGTTYHFRVVAESEGSKVLGEDKSFTTLKLPDGTTEAATAIKATQATLNGKVNPLGSATKYWFEYGETASYGTQIPVSPESAGSGTEYVAVSKTPTGLKEGTTYHFRLVAESEAGKVPGEDKSFTTLKLPDAITEPATAIKATQATLNGKVNPLGFATTYWFEYGETSSYGTKIPISPESVGSGTEYVAVSQTPTGLKETTTYHFRVVAESETGQSIGIDRTFNTPPLFSFSFGTEGSGNGQFLHPAESAADAEGNVWVADMNNNRIEEFNPEGKYLSQFGEEGSGKGQLKRPKSVAIDAEGNIWVADAWNNRIEEFNPEGKYLSQFGEEGSKPGQFASVGPESIAIDAEGDIWVADTYNGRLQKFDPEGNLIEIVGSSGSEPGQFGQPTGVDIGPTGNIWVADWLNKRVSEFNEAGEFIRQFGKEGSGDGQFISPDGIEVDEAGNVWVLDEGNGRIQRFNEEGEYVGKFGKEGSAPGKFNFAWPAGITSDSEGSLWIADPNNNRMQKWVW